MPSDKGQGRAVRRPGHSCRGLDYAARVASRRRRSLGGLARQGDGRVNVTAVSMSGSTRIGLGSWHRTGTGRSQQPHWLSQTRASQRGAKRNHSDVTLLLSGPQRCHIAVVTVGRDVVLELVRRTGGAAGAPRGGAEKGEPGRQDVTLPPAADGAGARLREPGCGSLRRGGARQARPPARAEATRG